MSNMSLHTTSTVPAKAQAWPIGHRGPRPPSQHATKRTASLFQSEAIQVCLVRSCQRQAVDRAVVCTATAVEAEEVAELSAEGIRYEEEARPKSNVLLTFNVPAKHCNKAWQRAIKALAKNINVPGFRAGKKLPEAVVVQQIGKEAVVEEALRRVLESCFSLIMGKYKDKAYGDSLQLVSDSNGLDFSKDNDLRFQASMDLHPTLTWTGDYTKMKVEVEAVGDEETDRELVKQKIWSALKHKGNLRVVVDRGLQKGDMAIVDFEARRASDGQRISGSERKGMQLDTMEEGAVFGLKGIVEDLVGKRAGDAISGTYTVKDAWWEGTSDSEVICDVKVKELFTWDVPELTDEVAKELLPGCSGLDGLWKQLIEAQHAITKSEMANVVNIALTSAVSEIVDVDIPEFVILTMAENEYQARLHEYQMNGRLDAEMIDKLASEEMLMQFMHSKREELEQMQKGVLGMEAIFQEQQLRVSEDEVRAEAEKALREAKEAKQEMDEERLMAQIYEVLKADKVMDFLTDCTEITIKPAKQKA